MGEVEQRELRLTERINMLLDNQVVMLKATLDTEIDLLQRRVDSLRELRKAIDLPDRAAELPLERTSGTCPSCGKKYSDPDLPAGVAVIV